MPPPYAPLLPVAPFSPGAWQTYGLGFYGQQTIATSSAPGSQQGPHWTVIPLPVPQVDDLTMQRRQDAIVSAYAGLLMDAVDLYRETVCRDGYKAGILKTMGHGLLQLRVEWRGDPEMIAALTDIRDANGDTTTLGDFSRMHPEAEASVIIEDSIGLGLGLGQYLLMCWRCDGVEWISTVGATDAHADVEICKRCCAARQERPAGTRELHQLRWRNPRWLWRRITDGQWFYNGRNGMVPVNPGDGEWFLLQTVPDQDLWIHGPWAMGTKEAIFKRDAAFDLQGISATCGPAHVFTSDGSTTPAQREESEAQAQKLRFQNMLFLPYPVKHEIHAAQGGESGYVGTADRISDRTDKEWEVYVTGIQQGTTAGSAFENAGVIHRVSGERRDFYANKCWIRTVMSQGLRRWAAQNFGKPCPIGSIDCASPEDRLADGKADEQEGKALTAIAAGYASVGYELAPAYIEERAQTKGLRVRAKANGHPAGQIVLGVEGTNALVQGFEGRAGMGLQPFGDARDKATVAALLNAAKGAATPGDPTPPAPATDGANGAPAPHPPPPPAPAEARREPPPAPAEARREPPPEEEDHAGDEEDEDGCAARAKAMNTHGHTACRHGRTQCCDRCGVRGDWMPDAGGTWRVTWRPAPRPRARRAAPPDPLLAASLDRLNEAMAALRLDP